MFIDNSSSVVAIEDGVPGRSEIIFTSRREEEHRNENPRNPPPYVEKREREIASSNSDLSPKRTTFGDFGAPMAMETDKSTPENKGKMHRLTDSFRVPKKNGLIGMDGLNTIWVF